MKVFVSLKYLIVFAFIITVPECYAQHRNIDSLLTLLKNDKADTNRIYHFNKLSTLYNKGGLYDSAQSYSKQSVELCNKLIIESADPTIILSVKNSLVWAYNNLGTNHREQGNYPKALEYHLKALKIYEDMESYQGTAKILSNIGIVYMEQGDRQKALNYYHSAMKIDKRFGDERGLAIRMGNIANVYTTMAEDCFISGLTGSQKACDSLCDKALYYYLKALTITEKRGDKSGMATWLGNIGTVYNVRHNEFKALEYYMKSLKLFEELGNKNKITTHLANIGSLYINSKKYEEAEKYLMNALEFAKELGVQDKERRIEESLSDLFEKKGEYEHSLEHYKRSMALKDSIFSEEKNKELTRKEMNYEFDKKEAATKADQEKKDAVTKIIIYSVSAGFALVLLLAIFIFRSYRQKQKANIIISLQKQLVEEKQKEILDSINYARRIQRAQLPNEKYIFRKMKELKKQI